MTRLQAHKWIQQQLGRERAAAVMHIVDEVESVAATIEESELTFGPYGVSPITGLHFDNADDTVAS